MPSGVHWSPVSKKERSTKADNLLDTGSRVTPEPDGSVRLRRAYHEPEGQTLVRIRGTLIYQPVEGISLPPIDIDVS